LGLIQPGSQVIHSGAVALQLCSWLACQRLSLLSMVGGVRFATAGISIRTHPTTSPLPFYSSTHPIATATHLLPRRRHCLLLLNIPTHFVSLGLFHPRHMDLPGQPSPTILGQPQIDRRLASHRFYRSSWPISLVGYLFRSSIQPIDPLLLLWRVPTVHPPSANSLPACSAQLTPFMASYTRARKCVSSISYGR